MNSNKFIHKNIVLPTIPDHSENRNFQNVTMTACLGLTLLCAMSLIVVML